MGKINNNEYKRYSNSRDYEYGDYSEVVRERKRAVARQKRRRIRQLKLEALSFCTIVLVGLFIAFGVHSVSGLLDRNEVKNSQELNGGVGTDKSAKALSESKEAAENSEFLSHLNDLRLGMQVALSDKVLSNVQDLYEQDMKPASVYGIYAQINEDDINSTYISLYDVDNDMLLAGYGPGAQIYPASMTKIMTLIVSVENMTDMNMTGILTKEEVDYLYQKNASTVGFDVQRKVTATDMLYGLILPSGADAAIMLAKAVAGSEEAFVKLMNDKCRELGLSNTHFMNVTGLHDDGQYTTTKEMCLIMKYAMENPLCAEVLSTLNYRTNSTTKLSPNGIALTNKSIQRLMDSAVEGTTVVGAKSGYTKMAGNCLASCIKKNGHTYIVVSAKAESADECVEDVYKLYTDYLPE